MPAATFPNPLMEMITETSSASSLVSRKCDMPKPPLLESSVDKKTSVFLCGRAEKTFTSSNRVPVALV